MMKASPGRPLTKEDRSLVTRSKNSDRAVKDVILQSAIDNYQRLGYHGTSMRDIARDAGITAASIYHHFRSKQAILQAIMTRVHSDAMALTRGALMRAGPSATDQLDAVVRAWVLFHTARRADALIGASELRSLDEVGLRLVITLRDEQERMFRDIVERGVSDGEFSTNYPRDTVRAILNMGSSISAWYRSGGDLLPEEMAERYAFIALNAVGAHTVV